MVFRDSPRSTDPATTPPPNDVGIDASSSASLDYRHLRSQTLVFKAASAFVIGLAALLFDVDVPSFLILYALYVGFAMFVTAPMMFVADRHERLEGQAIRDFAVSTTAMFGLWVVAVLLPLWTIWSGIAESSAIELPHIAWSAISLPAAASLLVAWFNGWRYARMPVRDRVAIGFARPVFERALCIVAFVVFGPVIFEALVLLGAEFSLLAKPATAMVIAYAVCEAYPFAAALMDRVLAARAPLGQG